MTASAMKNTAQKGPSVLIKIIAIFLGSTVIVMGLTFFKFSSVVEELIIKSIHKSAISTTADEAEGLAAPLTFRKTEDISYRIEKLAANEGSLQVYSIVFDLEGNPVASSGPMDESQTSAAEGDASEATSKGEMVVSDGGLRVTAPILDRNGAAIGALTIQRSADSALAEARQDLVLGMTIAAVITLALAAGTSLLLRHWISKPIVALEKRTDDLAHGDLDSPVPGTDRNDEIGKTSLALEALRLQLSDARETSRKATIAGAGFGASSAPLAITDTDLSLRQSNDAFRRECQACLPVLEADTGVPADILSRLPGFDASEFVSGELPASRDLDIDGRTVALAANQVLQDGEIIAYVFELKDMTAQQNDAALLKALDDSMYRADFNRDGTLHHANKRFTGRFGELEGKAIWAQAVVVSGNQDLEGILASGETFTGELQLGVRILSGALAPVCNTESTNSGYVLLASDITEERAKAVASEKHREKMEVAQAEIVDRLTEALGALAEGKLTTRIETNFAGEHDRLRQDFNSALQSLDQAIVQVLDKAINIKGETDNISNAADDLSKRTEKQAATLEQFAAALTEITESVSSAADGAARADEVVSDAREDAEASGAVVREAVSAMSEIATSSQQISKIIGVIDDIAFQTNLLALNAGVEAARAGDAGRGFAVVASEVRALAQRSSDAAREINDLISASGTQVERGVSLVDKTGDALKGIVESVREIAGLVANIAMSAQEQSKGLTEINSAISQLDQVTQQNVAMFEETTAATRMLSEEADNLTATTARFTTSGASAFPAQKTSSVTKADHWRRDEIKASSGGTSAPSTDGNAALADDDWEEF